MDTRSFLSLRLARAAVIVVPCALVILAAPDAALAQAGNPPVRTVEPQPRGGRPSIGRIEAVAHDARGRIWVLDRERLSLTVLDSSGHVLTTLGGAERGVVENPKTLSLSRSGNALVYDGAAGEIVSVRVDASQRATVTRRAAIGVNATEACELNDAAFVLGRGTMSPMEFAPPVHRAGFSSGAPTSFGAPYGKLSPFAQIALAFGSVLCMDQARTLIVASDLYPELRAYAPDGSLRWAVTLDRWQPVSIREPSPGRVSIGLPPSGRMNVVASLLPIDDSLFAIQVGLQTTQRARPEELSDYETRVFRVRDGSLVSRRRDLPFIAFASERGLVGYRNKPTPQLLLYPRHTLTGSLGVTVR